MTARAIGLIAVTLCLVAAKASAQASFEQPPTTGSAPSAPAKAGYWQTLAKALEIRQNTNVKDDIAKPAFLTVTNPQQGPTTMEVAVGVLAPVASRAGSGVDALLDYQRSNVVDEEQDVFKAGATAHWRVRDLDAAGNSPLFTGRTDFQHDAIKQSSSWQLSVGYTHLFIGKHKVALPNLPHRVGGAFEFVYFPYAGVEFDRVASAADATAEGLIVRGVGQISIALYPVVRLRQKIECLATYTYRWDISDDTSEVENKHPLLVLEFNYFPLRDDKLGEFGFGVTYAKGEDPDEGFTQQQFWQFSLKFRLKKGR